MFAMFSCCDVNYLTVLAGGVSSLILGTLWYSPLLFGRFQEHCEEPTKSMAFSFAAEFMNSLVMTWGLLMLLNLIDAPTLNAGLYAGSLIWLGGVVPTLISQYIWKNGCFSNTLITAGHHLVMISIVVALNFFIR